MKFKGVNDLDIFGLKLEIIGIRLEGIIYRLELSDRRRGKVVVPKEEKDRILLKKTMIRRTRALKLRKNSKKTTGALLWTKERNT